MGSCDAASESKGFANQERDPRMGSCDAASESKGFANYPVDAGKGGFSSRLAISSRTRSMRSSASSSAKDG